ncbi:RAM signaling network component [Malassezia sp. CBS 17886]|nr:RAM signaling network component [Malassezia sp. CBS 17886]
MDVAAERRVGRSVDAAEGDAGGAAPCHAGPSSARAPPPAPAPRVPRVAPPPWGSVAPADPPTARVPGLRKLSLPTVGATQAAADAAAAAQAQRRHDHHAARENGGGGGASCSTSSSLSPQALDAADGDFAEQANYFRRLSALPEAPTGTPAPVLKFVDATRGILFALSQIYQALNQHISVSTEERLVAQFQRVLNAAGRSMSALVRALDRFDAACEPAVPDAGTIRSILEACAESLRAFRRTVTVLHMQLPQLEQSVDVRFSRTLLLMLYGSMNEVRNSAVIMAPHVAAVAPYVGTGKPAASSGVHPAPPGALTPSPASAVADLPQPSTASSPPLSATRSRVQHAISRSQETSFLSDAASIDSTLDNIYASPVSSTPLTKQRTPAGPSRVKVPATPSSRSPGPSPRDMRKPVHAPAPLTPAHRPPYAFGGARGVREGHAPGVDDDLLALLAQVTDASLSVWTQLQACIHTVLQGAGDARAHEDDRGRSAFHPWHRRLRDMDENCSGTLSLTRQLQSTLRRFLDGDIGASGDAAAGVATPGSAASGGAVDVHQLSEESNHFVRAIIHTSILVKSVSQTYSFPRDLLRGVGDLNQGCSTLATHLHKLGGRG